MLYNKIMYIQNKPFAVFWKLFIGAFSLILEWYLLSQFGVTALRLFPTCVLFIAAIYFLSSSLILALSNSKFAGKNPCPAINGMLIVAFCLMSGVTLASSIYQFYLPSLDSWVIWSISLILPVLVLFDWLLFVEKGRWKIMMPFYGLALPILYIATMIFTAEMLPETTELLYPLEVLDLREFGLWPAIYHIGATSALILIFGYILYILDFVLSGKLAKHIVLPHLKVVDVDENGNEIQLESENKVSKVQPEPEVETPELSVDPDVKTSKPQPEPISLSPEEKQAIDDLGEVLTEAIQEEISKQAKAEDHESEKVENHATNQEPEVIETSKVEVTKIVIVEDDQSEPQAQKLSTDQPKSQKTNPAKKPNQQNQKPSSKPNRKPNQPKSNSRNPHRNPNHKKSSSHPKITRY